MGRTSQITANIHVCSVVIYEPKEAVMHMILNQKGFFLIYCFSLYIHIITFVFRSMFNKFKL